jgi:hypothetical protein
MSQQLFVKLEKQIQELANQQKGLLLLVEKVKSNCFDEEDRQLVAQKLQSVIDTKKAIELTLQKKRDIYQNQIIGMEQQLKQRQQLLESQETIFKDFPDVLDFFAKKQTQLNQTLLSIKDQLQQ